MKAKEPPMRDDLVKVPALLDKKSRPVLDEWARLEGRSSQSHLGILLRRLARLYRDNPKRLEELGLLTPLAHAAGS